MKGQVMGMNSAVYSSTGDFSGISIAVPSNTIKREVPQIIATGTYKHPWLGANGIDLTPDVASAIGLNDTGTKGVLVVSIAQGSPADLAGIKEGTPENGVSIGNNVYVNSDSDIIVGADEVPINKIGDIVNYVNGKSVGDSIALKVLRDGQTQNVNVTLADRPSEPQLVHTDETFTTDPNKVGAINSKG
jgi:S1-C subfamily serine protease